MTLDALLQAVSYGYLYQKAQQLKPADVQTFVLCAKTPRRERLAELGYSKTEQPGLYHSENLYVRAIPLLILNELADTPYNAFVKCFASRKDAKLAAFTTLTESHFDKLPWLLWVFLMGLRRLWAIPEGDVTMKEMVTPEQVLEMGEAWYKLLIRQMSLDERLAELTPEERLTGLSPEEVLAQYKPEEVLAQYKPEERLAGLSLEEVEAWLEKQRTQQAKATQAAPPRPVINKN